MKNGTDSFASRLKAAMAINATGAAQLAEMTGMTEEAIRTYLKGEREPAPPLLLKVAKALGTTAGYLLGRTDSMFEEEEPQDCPSCRVVPPPRRHNEE